RARRTRRPRPNRTAEPVWASFSWSAREGATAAHSAPALQGIQHLPPGRIPSAVADQVDHHRRAAVSGRVVDPGLDVAAGLLGRPASLVERIGDDVTGGLSGVEVTGVGPPA